MQVYNGIAEAADAARAFAIKNEEELPEIVREKIMPLTGTGISAVMLITTFTESIYANRAEVPSLALKIAAGCADLINRMGYHDRLDGRAPDLVPVLRRDSGEKLVAGANWPDKTKDPDPLKRFLKLEEPEAVAPADTLQTSKD